MRRIRSLAVICAVATLAAAAPAQTPAGSLRAGAAKADITPGAEMFPLVSGQTFGSVHDSLFARALVLADGADKMVLVTADISALPRGEELPEAVRPRWGCRVAMCS